MNTRQSLERFVGKGVEKSVRSVISVIIFVGLVISGWNLFTLALNSSSPIYLVENAVDPLYSRGDVIIISHWNELLQPGDTVLYMQPNRKQPTLHRVMTVQEINQSKDYYLVTKNDNSILDARSVYPQGQLWLHRQDIMGKVEVSLPYFGLPFIWLIEYPLLKFVIGGICYLLWMIGKDNQ